MSPQLYGREHVIYLLVCIISSFVVCFCGKKFAKTEKSKELFIKCIAGVLFAIIFFNRLALVFEGEQANWMELVTDSFCSTSSYVLSLSILFGKKNNQILHFVWLISLAGGLIATFFPDFIGQNPSFLYLPTILGLLHHTVSALLVILLLLLGYLTIDYKKWYCTLWGFASYLTYGAFLMCVLDFSNPFYMVEPALSGTPFTAWVIAPIYIVVYALILFLVEWARKRRAKKTEGQ